MDKVVRGPRTLSLAAVMTASFAALFVILMAALFIANKRLAEDHYTQELTEYGGRQVHSLDAFIQQDLINGFHPAVVQKADRFLQSGDIAGVKIVLDDGTILFNRRNAALDGYDHRTIELDVMPMTGELKDAAVTRPLARITTDLSLKRVKDQVRSQQRELTVIWLGSILLACLLLYAVGRMVARPIATLREMIGTRDLEKIANTQAHSRVRELRALESEFSEMGRQLLAATDLARRNAQFAVIAKTTQMLAHDVRRPFSIFRTGLNMLRSAKDPDEMRQVLQDLTPEVDRAVSSVDGLIADVMEVGSTSHAFHPEPASPEGLIATSLAECLSLYPSNQVTFDYDFQTRRFVDVETRKIGRVFTNLIINALQAMNFKGTVWFHTRESNNRCEFCVGNSGSFIPAEHRDKLFEAFFTSGKKGGTGLGLAIVQKIVAAHGGQIWCESAKTAAHPEGQVEFYFSVPFAKTASARTDSLQSKTSGMPVIMLVEDNAFILEAWQTILKGDVEVLAFTSPELALHALTKDESLISRLSAVITDYHFDNSPQHGVDFAMALKARRSNLPVLLCSDLDVSDELPTGCVDLRIAKEPVVWSDLQTVLDALPPANER